jgi:hypothetical protein
MRVLYGILVFLFPLLSVDAQVVVTDQIVKQPISKVLNRWSDNYQVDFAFDSFELGQYNFTGEFQSVLLDEALQQLLEETPFRFRWVNATCIVFPLDKVTYSINEGNENARLISGVISDCLSGESLPFATVAAMKSRASTSADADGRFSLTGSADVVNDTLVVVYLGYTIVRFPFNWNERNAIFNIELVPTGAILPDVEIRATSVKPILFESEPSNFIVHPNLSGLRYGVGEADVFRSAQFAPGISGVQENNNGLFIRGSSSDQSQLLFDGFNIYHQDHFLGMFSSLNALAVKSVRVHKCPTEPSLGGRAAGAMEVIGKEGDLRKPAAAIDLGTMSISGSFETPLDTTGKASLFLCGRRSITEWLKGPAYRELVNTLYSASIVSDQTELPDNDSKSFDPDLLFQDVNAKFTYRSSAKDHFNASFYASRDDVSFTYADTTSDESINVSDIRYSDEASKSNRGASVRWIHYVSPRIEAHTSIGYSAFQGVYFSTDSIRNNLFAIDSARFEYRDVLLRDWSATHRWQLKSSNHTFSWGVCFNGIKTNNQTRLQREPLLLDSRSAWVYTVFAGDEWRTARWTIQPALRFNYYNHSSSKLYSEPKLSARYEIFKQSFFLKAAVARAVQFSQRITNQSLYQNVPDQWRLADKTIPVLWADHLLFGLNWISESWNIDVEGYSKRTRGQLLNATAGQYTNAGFSEFYTGVAFTHGIDVGVQWERAPHRVLCSFSRIWSESNYDGFELQRIQESYFRAAEGKLIYEWKKGAWNASIVLVAAQGAPYTSLQGTYAFELPDGTAQVFPVFGGYNRDMTDPYFRTDAAVGYRWLWQGAQWQLNISVYNALDSQNYRAIQYSVNRTSLNELSINQRQIQMLGRIPSMNVTCRF